jgi:serine/threonine protein kinase
MGGCDPMLVCLYMANNAAAVELEYLHQHCWPLIIHCNLKPSNVVLNWYESAPHFVPKIETLEFHWLFHISSVM